METDSTKKAIRFWLDSTQDNLKAARVMLDSGRWSLCMFMCHQTIESLLKAVVIARTKRRPPYLHDLVLLSKACKLEPEEEILKVLKEGNKHYIKTRYKDDRFNLRIYNKDTAKYLLEKTEEVIKWFTKKMNLEP